MAMIAGVALAALAIPKVMGSSSTAGMPVITGPYTILLPLLAFAILGSSSPACDLKLVISDPLQSVRDGLNR